MDGRCAIDIDIVTPGIVSEQSSEAEIVVAAQRLLSACVQGAYRGGVSNIGEPASRNSALGIQNVAIAMEAHTEQGDSGT